MRRAIIDTESLNSDGDINGLSNLQEIQQNFDPGWRSPEFNFILFADMSFSTKAKRARLDSLPLTPRSSLIGCFTD